MELSRAHAAVVERLQGCRVVPVVTIEDPTAAAGVGAALRAGGIGCVEITFRHPSVPSRFAARARSKGCSSEPGRF